MKYLEEIKDIDPSLLVYSDETGIDDNEVKMSGWAKKGIRCNAIKKAFRKLRLNITAALCNGKLFAPLLFEGYSTKLSFEAYIEHVLVPELTPGMVLVIDNASFHTSSKAKKLVEAVGCRIIFLPPYTPQFNPIEHWWAGIKDLIKKAASKTKDFYEAAIKVLEAKCAA